MSVKVLFCFCSGRTSHGVLKYSGFYFEGRLALFMFLVFIFNFFLYFVQCISFCPLFSLQFLCRHWAVHFYMMQFYFVFFFLLLSDSKKKKDGQTREQDYSSESHYRIVSPTFQYKMSHQRVGKCIIINNKNFDEKTGAWFPPTRWFWLREHVS